MLLPTKPPSHQPLVYNLALFIGPGQLWDPQIPWKSFPRVDCCMEPRTLHELGWRSHAVRAAAHTSVTAAPDLRESCRSSSWPWGNWSSSAFTSKLNHPSGCWLLYQQGKFLCFYHLRIWKVFTSRSYKIFSPLCGVDIANITSIHLLKNPYQTDIWEAFKGLNCCDFKIHSSSVFQNRNKCLWGLISKRKSI